MTRDPTLLESTRARVYRWTGFSGGRTYRDDVGAYAFSATRDGTTFLCVCKRQHHAGLASFMRKVVSRARGEGYVLVEFVGEAPTLASAYAFDPETVHANGEDSRGDSAKGVATDWLELPADEFGVLLGEYVSGRAELVPPQKPPAGQATLGGLT